MRRTIMILIPILIYGCNKVETNYNANLSGSFASETISEKITVSTDSNFAPTYGNGILHYQPNDDFINNYPLFQSLLQTFKYEALPYNLDAFMVDKTSEDWEKETALPVKYFPYLIDAIAFQAVDNITNPKEKLTDFYQIYPIAKFNETELYHSLLYVVRYLDGNGQQDIFYFTTFSNEGVLLSALEIGALEASAETYIKTAQIQSQNFIKVHRADYNNQIKDWEKTSESEYFLDKTGEIYVNYENVKIQATSKDKHNQSIKEVVSRTQKTEFANYFSLFQKELRNNAPNRLVNYITFPHFRVSYEEHYQDFRSKEEFFAQYPIIFNETLRKQIIRQNINDLIVKDEEYGLSDGSIWFKRIGRDNDGKLVVAIRVN